MVPTLQRTYSKAKAVANNVVWTNQETIPATFTANGLLSDGIYGLLNITGRPMFCSGFQIDFTVPSQDPGMQVQIELIDKNNVVVPGSTMLVYGFTCSQIQNIAPAYIANSGTSLRFQVTILNGIQDYLPRDLTMTYMVSYANGLQLNQPGFNGIAALLASAGYVLSGTGSPSGVVFPNTATALYLDITVPALPVAWYWNNGTWTRWIG